MYTMKLQKAIDEHISFQKKCLKKNQDFLTQNLLEKKSSIYFVENISQNKIEISLHQKLFAKKKINFFL